MDINFVSKCDTIAIRKNDLLEFIEYGEGNCDITVCYKKETVTFMRRDNVWVVVVGRESFTYSNSELRKLFQFELELRSSQITLIECILRNYIVDDGES